MSRDRRHQLAYVDDRPCSALRPCSLNYRLFDREDILPILLRTMAEELGPEYIEATAHLPQFYVDTAGDPVREAERFRYWCADKNLTPTRFCCMSEPRQEFWQAFACASGLNGFTQDVAHALRHKPTMKAWIRAAGLRTAEYMALDNIADLLHFAEVHAYPVVLKPVAGWGARATYILRDEAAAQRMAHLIDEGSMMVETYIPYAEYECCALLANGRVLDVFPSVMPTPPAEVMRGGINANISVAGSPFHIPVDQLRRVVQQLISAFRLRSGYLHLEFFSSSDGEYFYVSELALRYPGCEIAKNHGLAYGFDIASTTIDIYLGLVPELRYGSLRSVGDLLLPYVPGAVEHISSKDELLRLPGVLEVHLGVAIGDVLPEVEDASYNCSGWVFVEGVDPAEVEDRMSRVLQAFSLVTS